MSKSPATSLKVNLDNFLPSIFIIAFLIVGFIPNIGAVDKIAPQWLYLSGLNIICASYLLYKRSHFSDRIINIIRTPISVFYLVFFFWASLSYFYAINSTEVLVNMARQSNTVFMYFHIAIFVYNIKNKNILISWLMTIILSIEVYSVFNQAIQMIESSGVITPGLLKGVTANRNITAFSIALKIPFVFYLLYKLKNKFIVIVLVVLILFCLLDISMISSRASFIAVGIIFIGYLFLCIYKLKFAEIKDTIFKSVYRISLFIVPFILAIFINQIYFSSKGADAISRAGTISIAKSDESISKRLRYYEDVLNHMASNPIFGTGIGNWKLESIKYDRLDIDGYVVPYHAHSDFIQIGAELGFVGFFLYLFIFISAIFFVYKIFFKSKLSEENKFFSIFLLISLGVYLIDANLNFPIARPQELAPFATLIGLLSFYYIKINNDKKDLSVKLNTLKFIFPLFMIMFSIPALSITNKTYQSHISQLTLLNDFNNNTFNVPLNKIESFIPKVPNITVTTIPMDAIKARYYSHYKKYDKALSLLKTSKKQNPYLFYSDAMESSIYYIKEDYEKSKIAAEKAFYNLPKNAFHISQFINAIIKLRDEESLEKAFKLLVRNDHLNGWKNYLAGVANISNYGNPIYIKRAKKALKLFPQDDDIKILFKNISVGQKNVVYASELATDANELFNNKNYDRAAELYDLAISYDPYEYSYFENASISYYSIQNYDRSLERINVVINEMNPLDGKCEYLKALNYLQLGLISDSCELFKTSLASGYSASETLINQYCSN